MIRQNHTIRKAIAILAAVAIALTMNMPLGAFAAEGPEPEVKAQAAEQASEDSAKDEQKQDSAKEEQKQDAVDAMVKMTDVAEKEADAEMLLEAKGFTNVVVSISDECVDVVLDMGEVTDAKRAQVEDVVKRKTGVEAEKIVITPINAGNNKEE